MHDNEIEQLQDASRQADARKAEAALFNTQEAEIAGIIAKGLGIDAVKVTRDANLIEDLGADSLDVVELVMDTEEHFGIEITDDEAEKLETVADAFALVAAKSS